MGEELGPDSEDMNFKAPETGSLENTSEQEQKPIEAHDSWVKQKVKEINEGWEKRGGPVAPGVLAALGVGSLAMGFLDPSQATGINEAIWRTGGQAMLAAGIALGVAKRGITSWAEKINRKGEK